jgi:hypothetical protein
VIAARIVAIFHDITAKASLRVGDPDAGRSTAFSGHTRARWFHAMTLPPVFAW